MMNVLKVSPSVLFASVLGLAFVMGSCDKEEAMVVIDSPIVGRWETTTFQVSGCVREGEDVELRDCGFSEHDDVECGISEFRSDGQFIGEGQTEENPSHYTVEGNVLTMIVQNDSIAFRFETSADAMTWYHDDFNGDGCELVVDLVRVN